MLAIATAVSAQVSLGVKGGVNMSNFWGGEELNSKNAKFGFNIGLAAEYEFAPAMAIQSGLFLQPKAQN